MTYVLLRQLCHMINATQCNNTCFNPWSTEYAQCIELETALSPSWDIKTDHQTLIMTLNPKPLTVEVSYCNTLFCIAFVGCSEAHSRVRRRLIVPGDALKECISSSCPVSCPPKRPLGWVFNYRSQLKSNQLMLFLSSCQSVIHKLTKLNKACNF